MSQSVLDRVQQVFRDVYGKDVLVLTLDQNPQQIDGWTSLNQMNIVLALEEEFNITFDSAGMERIGYAKTISDVLQVIGAHV